jgi:aminotransferase EvaB
MTAISEFASGHGLTLLEDCAQSTGATQNGRMCGTWGNASAFSFYPTKVLGTYGDGGMVCTSDPAVDARLRSLRMYGMKGTYYAEEHGYNSRLDELHAAILAVKLRHVERWIDRRRELAARYRERLSGSGLGLPVEAPGNRHVFYVYVVRHPERDRILADLKKQDIICNISYPFPITTMRGYAHLGYKEGDVPVSEAAAREIFSLPMYPTLSDEMQDRVCKALWDIL